MKRIFSFVLCFIIILNSFLLTSFAKDADDFSISAKAALFYDINNDATLYEKNIHERIEPSLLAQIMTAILAIENIPDPENVEITYSTYAQNYMYEKNIELDGIKLSGLRAGDTLSALNLIYAVLLRDASDAAFMLAQYISENDMAYFLDMMNEKAQQIGAADTYFNNTTGLADSKSHTTAYDMMLITSYAMENTLFYDIVNTSFINGGSTKSQNYLYWTTSNKLLLSDSKYYDETCEGVKFGWHDDLGSYLITTTIWEGNKYFVVLLGCTGEDELTSYNACFEDFTNLRKWVTKNFNYKTLIEKGSNLGEISLKLGIDNKDFLRLKAKDSISCLLPSDIKIEDIETKKVLPNFVTAPIKEGDLIGEIHFYHDSEDLGVVGIVSAEDVQTSRFLVTLDKLVSLIHYFWIKVLIIFLLLVIIVAIIYSLYNIYCDRVYRRRRR